MPGRLDRGVAPVIGFILVFSFLVLAFTIYQGVVVPDQNRRVEFQHNQQVQNRMQELRNSIVSVATTGSGRSVSIQLGADYPQRTLAQNLGFSAGSIRTETISSGGIVLRNVTADDAETKDYFGESSTTLGPFPNGNALKSIAYDPIYSFYSNAPTTYYANTLAYNQFDRANLTLTNQLLIDGTRLTIVVLVGNLSNSGSGTVTIDPEAVSAPTNRVSIENEGGVLNLTIPARNFSMWNETLADEPRVRSVSRLPGDRIAIHLKNGSYQLGMALVKVGSGPNDVPAHYVTDVEGDDTSIPENSTQKLVVEARDRYNNPQENVTVTARIEGASPGVFDASGSTVANKSTDATGRATFVYNVSDVSVHRNVKVNVSIGGANHPREWVVFDLRVLNMQGGTATGALPPFRFLSIVRAPPAFVASGSTHLITVDVRNETHVPVNATVIANVVNTTGSTHNGTFRDSYLFANRSKKTTGSDGQVTFNFTAPATLDATLRMTFNVSNTTRGRGNVSLTVNVTSDGTLGGGGGGGGGGNINPGGKGEIRLVDAFVAKNKGNAWVNITLNNTGSRTTVAKARFQFYFADSQGSTAIPGSIELNESGEYLNLRGPSVTISTLNVPSGESSFCIDFFQDADGSGDFSDVEIGDFFVVTVVFSNGQSATYFVAPRIGTVNCP